MWFDSLYDAASKDLHDANATQQQHLSAIFANDAGAAAVVKTSVTKSQVLGIINSFHIICSLPRRSGMIFSGVCSIVHPELRF